MAELTPDQIKAAQEQAKLNRLSDNITRVSQGFTEFAANVAKARDYLANPLIITAITSLTDEQLVAMNHARYEAEWFRDALAGSVKLREFLNTKLDPNDANSPTILEAFYRVMA